MPKSKHDSISEQVAKARGTKYNPVKGPDINALNLAAEVEVNKNNFAQGIRQLQGFTKPVYLCVPDELKNEAIKRTKGTTIGVMDERGKILKRSARKKR